MKHVILKLPADWWVYLFYLLTKVILPSFFNSCFFSFKNLSLNFNKCVENTDYIMTIKRKEAIMSSNKWVVVSEKHPHEKSTFPFSLPTPCKQPEAKHAARAHAQSCDAKETRTLHVLTDTKHF